MFNNPFISGESYQLDITNISDLSGNVLATSDPINLPDPAKACL